MGRKSIMNKIILMLIEVIKITDLILI
jgi:hypothetical protein